MHGDVRMSAYDADTIHAVKEAILSLLDFLHNQLIEPLAAVLLHALETKAHIDRKVKTKALVSLEDVEPAQDRTLVIRRAPSNKPSAFVVYYEFKWIGVPSIRLECLIAIYMINTASQTETRTGCTS